MCETFAILEGFPPSWRGVWAGLKLAGKGRLSSAFAISLGTNRAQSGPPQAPIELGAVRPQESPGLEVCEIPQIARFSSQALTVCSDLHPCYISRSRHQGWQGFHTSEVTKDSHTRPEGVLMRNKPEIHALAFIS